ncbi:unnamed protein product [Owenia fusiformis]|uniref:RING-type E3 ubiquitin transferase n=1 Tax=Owenia fusiformis TaxID=6347 RepID=A0A8J1UAU3_OWEFU|nr:unnamed protein product [Owenia fusiformis]
MRSGSFKMASGSKRKSGKVEKTSLFECTCPVCMYILIEPVTMPCNHELCMPCFKKNVQETSLLCPICRTRIATWSRRASKTNSLIDYNRWKQIQELFPTRVRNRIEGRDDSDSSDEESVTPVFHTVAEPGEVRREYELELKKLQAQQEIERQKEAEESEALIRQLQEEEERLEEERRRALDRLQLSDELLAKELSSKYSEGLQSPNPQGWLYDNISPTSRVSSNTTHKNNPVMDKFLANARSRSQSKTDLESLSNRQSGSGLGIESHSDLDPYNYTCISPSEKESKKLQGLLNDTRLLDSNKDMEFSNLLEDSTSDPVIPLIYLSSTNTTPELQYKKRLKGEPASSSNGSSVTVEKIPTPTFGFKTPSSESEILLREMSQSGTSTPLSAVTSSKKLQDVTTRPSSVESGDSISGEMSHFKPIKSCPLTPPKCLPSGKILRSPVIRSTPRNLSRPDFQSSGLTRTFPLGSPAVQRRIQLLAEERKGLIHSLSKSTYTELNQIKTEHSYSSPKRRLEDSNLEEAKPNVEAISKKLKFEKVIEEKDYILPLEPKLDEIDGSQPEGVRPLQESTMSHHKDNVVPQVNIKRETPVGMSSQPSTSARSPGRVYRMTKSTKNRNSSKPCQNGTAKNTSTITNYFRKDTKVGIELLPNVTTTPLTPRTLEKRIEQVRKGVTVKTEPTSTDVNNIKVEIKSEHFEPENVEMSMITKIKTEDTRDVHKTVENVLPNKEKSPSTPKTVKKHNELVSGIHDKTRSDLNSLADNVKHEIKSETASMQNMDINTDSESDKNCANRKELRKEKEPRSPQRNQRRKIKEEVKTEVNVEDVQNNVKNKPDGAKKQAPEKLPSPKKNTNTPKSKSIKDSNIEYTPDQTRGKILICEKYANITPQTPKMGAKRQTVLKKQTQQKLIKIELKNNSQDNSQKDSKNLRSKISPNRRQTRSGRIVKSNKKLKHDPKQPKIFSKRNQVENNNSIKDESNLPLDSPEKFIHDFKNDDDYWKYVEERDRLIAIKLQQDYELEAKLNLTSIRTKGSSDEYKLRTRRSKRIQH